MIKPPLGGDIRHALRSIGLEERTADTIEPRYPQIRVRADTQFPGCWRRWVVMSRSMRTTGRWHDGRRRRRPIARSGASSESASSWSAPASRSTLSSSSVARSTTPGRPGQLHQHPHRPAVAGDEPPKFVVTFLADIARAKKHRAREERRLVEPLG